MFVQNKEYEINTSIADIDNASIRDLRRSNMLIYNLMLNQEHIVDYGDRIEKTVGNTKRIIRKNK